MLSSGDGVGLSHIILPDTGVINLRLLSPWLWPMLHPAEKASSDSYSRPSEDFN